MKDSSEKETVDERRSGRRPSDAERDELRSAAAAPVSGTDRYVAGDEIARGGMGRVVDATDTVLGRRVAVKEVLATDADLLRRFQREVRITARLEHPSIVPVYDAGTTATGAPFYVMRKVSGRPLEQLIAATRTLSERLALVPHVLAAAQAVAHAHGHRIIHRDLKPSNILVGNLGETVVIDWGIAKVIGEADELATRDDLGPADSLRTRIGTVVGTPGFMSPEQLRSSDVDARSDVYALGATLYFVLARKPPHEGETSEQMMARAATDPAQSIASVVAGVPRELAAIVDKALAFDERLRYPDGAAFAEDLQRFLTGQLVASHHYTAAERIARFIRRHRLPLAITAIAVAALGIGGWLALGRVLAERDRADAQARLATDRQRDAERERARATERAERLTLEQARTELTTNPTAAVALVKPLANGPLWREARDIAAGARAKGVAWHYPAALRVMSLELAPDGTHAVSSGNDGKVWIYDLVQRRADTVYDAKQPVRSTYVAGGRALALYTDTTLLRLDLATHATRTVTLPSRVTEMAVAGADLVWIDDAGRVVRLAGDATEIVPIAVADHIKRVVAAPDGHAVLLGGAGELWLWTAGQPVRPVVAGPVVNIAWRADSQRAAAITAGALYEIELAPLHAIRRSATDEEYGLGFVGTRIAITDNRGLVRLDGKETRMLRNGISFYMSMYEAPGEVLVGADHEAIVLHSAVWSHVLLAPVTQLMPVHALPSSRFIVGASQGMVLAWDLSPLAPRMIATEDSTGFGWAGPHHLLIEDIRGASWLDLHTGEQHRIALPPLSTVAPSADGRAMALSAGDERHGRVVFADGSPDQDLGTGVVTLGLLDARTMIFGTRDGALVQRDLAARTQHVVTTHSGSTVTITWNTNGHLIAGEWRDGWVYRRDLVHGREASIALGSDFATGLHLQDDGTTFVAVGSHVARWRADGTLDPAWATVPARIQSLYSLDTHHMLATATDGSAYVVGTDARDDVRSSAAVGLTNDLVFTQDGMLVVRTSGTYEILDALTGLHWRMVDVLPSALAPALSSDGSKLAATIRGGILVWDIDLPTGPEATARWLDTLTNATAEHGTSVLDWH